MVIPRQLDDIFIELEQLDHDWSVDATADGYSMIWSPDGKIRLWSVPRTTGFFLRQLVLIHRPKNIVEVGTSAGYSTLWMASAATTYGGNIYTIEAAEPKIAMAANNFSRSGLGEVIDQRAGLAADVLADFDAPIDFLFMDADKANYLSYLKIIESKLSDRAVIVADNAVDFGDLMQDFIEYLAKSEHFDSQVLDIDHGILLAVRT